MTALELLNELENEINAIGGYAGCAYERGMNFAVEEAIKIIEAKRAKLEIASCVRVTLRLQHIDCLTFW